MSIAMDSPSAPTGLLSKIKAALGIGAPSRELSELSAATARLESAASKIETAASKLDPLGELVDGLRTGPEERVVLRRRKRRKKSRP